jgi:hypothetical protein
VHYPLGRSLLGKPPVVKAVAGITLDIPRGSFFGLVGERARARRRWGARSCVRRRSRAVAGHDLMGGCSRLIELEPRCKELKAFAAARS